MNDLALALRFVRRSPGLAAAAIISLALGIGVSIAAMGLSMLALSAIATLWPAFRATRTDPAQTLRAE